MELHGEVLVAAPRERIWAALNDAAVLQRCIPGCEAMEVLSETEKRATVAVKVGPVRARFQGRVRLEDIRPGEGCTLQFEGQGGAAGMARGSAQVTLTDEDGGTRVSYATQASVAGKLGQVGGRMIDAAARQMADQFFAAFQAEVAPEAAASDEAGDAAAMADADGGHALPASSAATAATTGSDGTPAATVSASPSASTGASAPGSTAAALSPASATSTIAASSTSAPAIAASRPAARPASPPPASGGEFSRVLWFVLGSLSTGFGVWLGHALTR